LTFAAGRGYDGPPEMTPFEMPANTERPRPDRDGGVDIAALRALALRLFPRDGIAAYNFGSRFNGYARPDSDVGSGGTLNAKPARPAG
jgi:hypothetical protein